MVKELQFRANIQDLFSVLAEPYHKLAGLYSLRVYISEDKDNYSLSIERWEPQEKINSKTPNVNDFITNIDSPPHSDRAGLNPLFEGK